MWLEMSFNNKLPSYLNYVIRLSGLFSCWFRARQQTLEDLAHERLARQQVLNNVIAPAF